MEYPNVSEQYKEDLLAAALVSREQEHFHYNFDKENFEAMLLTLPEGPFKEEIKERLRTTLLEMEKVECIHTALKSKPIDPDKLTVAITRMGSKVK